MEQCGDDLKLQEERGREINYVNRRHVNFSEYWITQRDTFFGLGFCAGRSAVGVSLRIRERIVDLWILGLSGSYP